jgi:hypothetical protein
MPLDTLVEISIVNWSLQIIIGPIILVGLLFFFIFLIYKYWKGRTKKGLRWKSVEIEAALANVASIKFAPTYETVRVAHQAWTELVTRKASLPFDEENDVIIEIYDSWYELFREIRTLAKSIPAEEFRENQDTQQLVNLLVDALNKGIRPHLTKWQAKIRYWHSQERAKYPDLSPQDLQRLFPQYKELTNDLKLVNDRLIGFAKALSIIAHGQ